MVRIFAYLMFYSWIQVILVYIQQGVSSRSPAVAAGMAAEEESRAQRKVRYYGSYKLSREKLTRMDQDA